MNKLVFGKNNQEKIVSIEVEENKAILFIEESPGNILKKAVDNTFWLLSSEPLNSNSVRLDGNLHYKYGLQFDDKKEYLDFKYKNNRRDVFSIPDDKEALMIKDGYTYFKGLNPKEISILSFDIETTGLNHNKDSKVLLISNTFRVLDKIEKKLFCFDDFPNEGEMIKSWCEWVREKDPSILVGHNIYSFDLPYIKFIADKFNIPLLLGRDNSELNFFKKESKFRKDGSQDLHYKKVRCYGREIIDTYFLAIRHDSVEKKYESYGLKQIIKQENLEDLDRQFYDASLIRKNYNDKLEWEKIKRYCINDSDDSLKVFDLMSSSVFYMTQSIPKTFQQVTESASGSQINSMMIRAYLQDKHSISKADTITEFQGGISFGIPGVYKNCWKIDIKSCYPSAILINKLYSKHKDPNGYMYELCKYFTEKRFEYKKLYKETKNPYYQSMDQSAKIFINSIFGFCSASGLNFNDSKVASLITDYGRKYLNLGSVWATGHGLTYWNNNEQT